MHTHILNQTVVLLQTMTEEETCQIGSSWKGIILFWGYSILMGLPIILVFIFFNYYGLDLVMYAGWLVLVFGVVIILVAGYEFKKEGAPKGRSVVHTTVLVDRGVYAVIRHSQYLGFIMVVFAFVLMSQHWLSLISGIAGSILFYGDILKEEQSNIEKFGDDYKRYMQKVPYIVICGEEEVESNMLSIRRHTVGGLGWFSLESFVCMIEEDVQKKC
jgi:protein-S-isoprenylcysteine O-methyltransferase Ste14